MEPAGRRRQLGEVAAVFLKLGCIAFGGPAAHVAMMRREVVEQRGWLSEQDFLDLLGAANLIPGPSSTELAILLGYLRAGWPALFLAGGLFILPAMLIVLFLAWLYVRTGALPAAGWVLYGIKPVVAAIITDALWALGKTAIKGWQLGALAAGVFVLYWLGLSTVLLLLGGAVLFMLGRAWDRRRLTLPALGSPLKAAVAAVPAASYGLWALGLTFLKIGAVVYGSGYVLLAFLRSDFVQHLHWLTDRQLLDAVAVGQFTPGPVFTTATFIGYLVGGLPGGLLATAAVFLPSFLLVALIFPFIARLKASPWVRSFLDGANAAALGLMAAVTWQMGQAAITDVFTALAALAALAALRRFRPNAAWLVLAGGLAGWLVKLISLKP